MLSLLLVAFMAVSALADYSPIISFNKGLVQSGKSCSSTEWDRLKTAMGKALKPLARNLRATHDSNQQTRNLGFCDSCRLNPMCLASVGRGCAQSSKSRRTLTQTDMRQLTNINVNGNVPYCNAELSAIAEAFATVRPTVSSSCKALMDAPRNVTCAYFTRECDINYFSLWNADTERAIIPKLNATGTSFCSSLGRVTLKAETHFFLGKVEFNMWSLTNKYSRHHTEYKAPYYVHGNDGANVHGSKLDPGEYILKAESENDPSQRKEISFTVNDC